MYNCLSGAETAKIIGQKLTEALREYDDFGAHIGYDNPSFKITVEMTAMEIEPRTYEVKGAVDTAPLPSGTRSKQRSNRIEVQIPAMKQPDKERLEAGLPVPDPVRNELTGEVADFLADKGPF